MLYIAWSKFPAHKQHHQHRFCQYHQTQHGRNAEKRDHANPPVHGVGKAITVRINMFTR
ncbi:Uncharacterised protein [Vibrio cholerae]|nr:Uncharacterised protein [Vibrio cholerae]